MITGVLRYDKAESQKRIDAGRYSPAVDHTFFAGQGREPLHLAGWA